MVSPGSATPAKAFVSLTLFNGIAGASRSMRRRLCIGLPAGFGMIAATPQPADDIIA
jgi:hypothetical protein